MDNNNNTTENRKPGRRIMHILAKTIKYAAWTVMAILLALFATIVMITKVLNPQRLTPIVEQVASSVLDADIKISRTELSLWDNFPFLTIEIDSLEVLPGNIRRLPADIRSQLPQGTDTVMSFEKFKASVNLAKLATYTIELRDVELTSPKLTLVDISDGVSNYDIVRPSAEDDGPSPDLPTIEFNRICLIEPRQIKYYNLTDSTSSILEIKSVDFHGDEAPTYSMDIQTNIHSPLLEEFNKTEISIGLDGNIKWDQKHPTSLSLSGFTAHAAFITAKIDTEIEFDNGITVESLDLNLEPIPLSEAISYIPNSLKKEYGLDRLRSNADIYVSANLLSPFNTDTDILPHIALNVSVPDCQICYRNIDLGKFKANICMTTTKDGNPDNARIEIKELYACGRNRGLDISIRGILTNLLTDPYFNGTVNGNIRPGLLPRAIYEHYGTEIGGNITIDTEIEARPSQLNRNSFHNLHLKGIVGLDKVKVAFLETGDSIYIDHGKIELGTNNSFVHDSQRSPNLLTASLAIDSARAHTAGLSVIMTGFRAGMGCVNDKDSNDTTKINPIGATIRLNTLNMVQLSDSTRLRLRDVGCFATIKRYQHMERVPEIIAAINARRVNMGNRSLRFTLSGAECKVSAHRDTTHRRVRRHPMAATVDSLKRAHPTLPADSIFLLAGKKFNKHRTQKALDRSEMETIEFEIADGFARFLRNWVLDGKVSAKSARLFTLVFPLRNRMNNLALDFTSDSLKISNVAYQAGHSDFKVKGTISNMRRAVLSHGRSPLKIRFDMQSDTIDINQIAAAVFSGAAYSAKADSLNSTLDFSGSDSDESLEKDMENLQSSLESTGPLLIPSNIDADIDLSAKNIMYSDLLLHKFNGCVQVRNGALNLNNLTASSDVGSIDLSALYSAPRANDMSFGFGMQARDFNISRFLNLVPAIDSVLPLMRGLGGIIDAEIAATCDISKQMDIDIPSLKAAIKLHGDSLVVLDEETFKTISKWLFFKKKNRNLIDSMSVEMIVEDSQLQIFPFTFNFDRYKLGVMGNNDFEMNFNYHIGVLKSPIPFKFGVNVSGTPDKMKIRLGGCKFKKGMEVQKVNIVDTTRVNLLNQIRDVFQRGVNNGRLRALPLSSRPEKMDATPEADTLSAADSAAFIREGLIEIPPQDATRTNSKNMNSDNDTKGNKRKRSENGQTSGNIRLSGQAALRRD